MFLTIGIAGFISSTVVSSSMSSYDVEERGQARASQAVGSAFFVDMLEHTNWSVQLLFVDQEVSGCSRFCGQACLKSTGSC